MSDAIEIEGWNNYRLDEIGVIYSGATPSTTNLSFWDGSIVWITPSDLSDLSTAYLFDSKKKITEKGLEACSAHYLPANSITLSSRAPIGYVAIPQTGFCTNQGCKSILLDNGFDPEFVYHNLCFNIDKLKRLGEGTTFAEISKTALATVSLSFPAEKDEQTQIATILSTIDRAIEQTETIIAKQQRIKTGLMQDLLTCGIDEQGNVRSEATHEFKDSPLGRIPVEWDISSIGNEFVVQLGKMLSKKALDGELFDYLGNRSVQWDFIDTSSLPKMHFSDSERRKFSLEYGDVLICEG
ncbi:MAG: restriction endonuclease subunit S, partial [Thiolinea sp.]